MLVRHRVLVRHVRAVALAVSLLVDLAHGPRAFAQGVNAPAPATGVSAIRNGELSAAIERAVTGARRRLAQNACAAVFADFTTEDGRTLAEVAASLAMSAEQTLVRVIFLDGGESVSCRATRPAAFTGVGSRVVFVCPTTFRTLDRETAELVIIHELLHTLGLGERPPSSSDINKTVARRCS